MEKPLLLALSLGALLVLALLSLPLWRAPPGRAVRRAAPALADRGGRRRQPAGVRPGAGPQQPGRGAGRAGRRLRVALVGRLGEVGALEALADPFMAGFVSGRLVLAFDVPAEQLRRWREQAPPSEAMEGGVRRFELLPTDREQARSVRLVGLSFVPTAKLSLEQLCRYIARPSCRPRRARGPAPRQAQTVRWTVCDRAQQLHLIRLVSA